MKPNTFPAETTTATAATTSRSGKLVKRAEAARMLGMSVSTLRRREGDVLKPIVGPNGVHLFDETEVRAVMVTVRGRAGLSALGPSSGETAAEVFTLLDEGAHPVEIVKRLCLAPDVVIALLDQWTEMRGGFTVSARQAIELRRLCRANTKANAAAALSDLRQRIHGLTQMRAGSAQCFSCTDMTASICEVCVVRFRGPLRLSDYGIEERTTSTGVEEVRFVAGFFWDSVEDFVGDDDGTIARLRSDWYPVDELKGSDIAELVKRTKHRDAVRNAATGG